MSIRKRTWTTPSGEERVRWLVDYRDAGGKRRSKQFTRKRDAETWRTTAAWQVAQGVHTPDSQSVTIAHAASDWLRRAEREGLEEVTRRSYESRYRIHIEPKLAAVKLSRLTMPMVEEFRDELVEEKGRGLASEVVRALSMILANAQRRGLVAQNVASGVRVTQAKRHRKRPDIPSKADLRAILSAAEENEKPLIMTALFAGLRSSELRALRWQDVNLKAKRITVEQRADPWGVIGSPKSAAARRTVPLAPGVVKQLRKWKLACPNGELGLVFPNGVGKVESHQNWLHRLWYPLQKRAGVEKRHGFHSLRHAAVSLWIEQGVEPKRIQTWIGHASIQTTFDRYGHLFEARESDAGVMAAIEQDIGVNS